MSDRFDLEQDIMKCWDVVEDIKILNERILELDIDRDEISNFLIGLSTIYHAKFEKLFETFSTVMRNEREEKQAMECELMTLNSNLDRLMKKSKKNE